MNGYAEGWIRDAARRASISQWSEHLIVFLAARMRVGAAKYGDDAYKQRTVEDLVKNAAEEAADFVNWSEMASERLFELEDDGLTDDVRLHLAHAAASSLIAWHECQRALDALAER